MVGAKRAVLGGISRLSARLFQTFPHTGGEEASVGIENLVTKFTALSSHADRFLVFDLIVIQSLNKEMSFYFP